MDHDAETRLRAAPPTDPAAATAHQLIHARGATSRDLNRAGHLMLTRYGARIEKLLQRRLGMKPEDAEEVLCDAVYGFLQKSPRHCDCPEAWFIVTTLRAAISRLRTDHAQQRHPAHGFEPIGAPGDPGPLDACVADPSAADPLWRLIERERMDVIPALLKIVAERHSTKRAQVMSLLLAGHDHASIGATLGMKPGAVRDMVFRLHTLARDLIQELKPRT